MTESIVQFFAAWAEPDKTARDRQIGSAVGQTIFYADPKTPVPLTTLPALTNYVGLFTNSAPGWPVAAVQLTRTLDFVRATVRFGSGEQVQWGQYIADLDGSDRITRLVGFVGTGAAA